MKRRIRIFSVMICICLSLFCPGAPVQAASGKTAVSVSSGTVNIGDTVTVSVSATGASGEVAVATMAVSWDAGVLQFTGCSTTYGGGGGSITAIGDKFTVTFTAVSAGTSPISVSGSDGVVFDSGEELDSMAGSSTSVTVNNSAAGGGAGLDPGGGTGANPGGGTGANPGGGTGADPGGGTGGETGAPLSADNSLKSLAISPGTLSPSFAGKTTSYSATVENSVTSIAVSAVPANEKAVVESVTGNEGLKVGSNAVKIVVRAENGVTATYTVNVTRQGGGAAAPDEPEPEETGGENEPGETAASVMINGASWQIREDFAEEDIPADFTENTILYHGTEYRGVSFHNGSCSLLMLSPEGEEGNGRFFVYDGTRDGLYPFVKLSGGECYVIALWAPVDFVMPENYRQTELGIRDGESIAAYQIVMPEESEIGSGFYLFYAVNSEGTEGWYQYDSMEGTYQRLNTALFAQEETVSEEEPAVLDILQEDYDELSERYKETRRFMGGMIGALVFVIAVLLVILVNQLVHRFRHRGRGRDEDDFHDGDEWDDLAEDDAWDSAADEADWDDGLPGEDAVPRRRGRFFRKKEASMEETEEEDRPEAEETGRKEEDRPKAEESGRPEESDREDEGDWLKARAAVREEEDRPKAEETGRPEESDREDEEDWLKARASVREEEDRPEAEESGRPEESDREDEEDDWLKARASVREEEDRPEAEETGRPEESNREDEEDWLKARDAVREEEDWPEASDREAADDGGREAAGQTGQASRATVPRRPSGRFERSSLSAEEYAERREAAERFFAENPEERKARRRERTKAEAVPPGKSAEMSKENPEERKTRRRERTKAEAVPPGKSAAVKSGRKKESEKKRDDGFEVIDFNDL